MRRAFRLHSGRRGRQSRGLSPVTHTADLDETDTIIVNSIFGIFVDHIVAGEGIPDATTVLAIDDETNAVQLSAAATDTASDVPITFTPPEA